MTTNDALFAEYAGPEAIAVALRKATAQHRRWERRVQRLTDLHATRTAQIAAGTWPPKPGEQDDGPTEFERALAAATARRTGRIDELIEASSLGTPDAVAMRARTTPDRARQIVDRANGAPCCDMHNIHCEPPGDLCCRLCTEASHDAHPIPPPDGSRCVLPVPEEFLDFATGWRLAREGVDHTDPRCSYVRHDGGLLCDCGAIETEWARRCRDQQKARASQPTPEEKP